MTTDLAIFAARLRDYIGIYTEEFGETSVRDDKTLAQHADAEFNGMALVLFALQFTSNTAYRKLCEARGIRPDDLTHWTQIPAVPTAAFKELELTCLLPEQRTHVFHSSGTTEQRPSRHFHNVESLEVYEASLWPWFRENLSLAVGNWRLLSLTPLPAQVPHSSLAHMFDVVRQKLGADESTFVGRIAEDGSWTLNFDSVIHGLQSSDSKPMLLLGTAFSFVHLLDAMVEKKLRFQLPTGSLVMETGGYKGRSRSLPKTELHALITECLDVSPSHIVCEYGMSELSSQAYDGMSPKFKIQSSKSERMFHFPPWARVQIISPETGCEVAEGETGLIRVFDLANVFSVMAIQTEDLAVRRSNGFELLGRVESAEPRGCSLMAV